MITIKSLADKAKRVEHKLKTLVGKDAEVYKAKNISPDTPDEEIMAEIEVCKARLAQGCEVYYIEWYDLNMTQEELDSHKSRLERLGWMQVHWTWCDLPSWAPSYRTAAERAYKQALSPEERLELSRDEIARGGRQVHLWLEEDDETEEEVEDWRGNI